MPSKQTLIANIAFELCDTEAPGFKWDKKFGGMQKYIQHQRYSHHVMKEYDSDKNLCKRFGLWIEIRKWLKPLGLDSTMDTTPFTEEALQRAGMEADKLFKLPHVEGADLALSELMKYWSGTTIGVAERYGKNKDNKKMLQFKPKFKMEDIPKAPANSIVLLNGTVVLPTPDTSCVWLLPPMGRPHEWAEHHMRKRHEYTKEFQDFFDELLDRFLDLFSIDKPDMFREFMTLLADDKPAAYARFFPDYIEGYIKLPTQ
jgi:hypothetical protein